MLPNRIQPRRYRYTVKILKLTSLTADADVTKYLKEPISKVIKHYSKTEDQKLIKDKIIRSLIERFKTINLVLLPEDIIFEKFQRLIFNA